MCVYVWVCISHDMQRLEDNSGNGYSPGGPRGGTQTIRHGSGSLHPLGHFSGSDLSWWPFLFVIGHSHQLFHVCVILATHLQMEAILLDKTLRKEWLLATSRPFSLPQIAAAMFLCIIFSLSNIIYFSAALYRIPEPELHEKETWFQNVPGVVVKQLAWYWLTVAKSICSQLMSWHFFNGFISKKKKDLTGQS